VQNPVLVESVARDAPRETPEPRHPLVLAAAGNSERQAGIRRERLDLRPRDEQHLIAA
jgi:hypothetical protein